MYFLQRGVQMILDGSSNSENELDSREMFKWPPEKQK